MTPHLITSDEIRSRSLRWDAARAFADHEIRSETYWSDGYGAQWTIGKPGTNIFLVQIVSALGALIVHGDIDFVRFAHCGHTTAFGRVLWMAEHPELDSYVAEKAGIGSGRRVVDSWDARVVRSRLKELADQEDEDRKQWGDDGSRYELRARLFREAMDHTDSDHEFFQFLYDSELHTDDWCEHSWHCVAPQVYFAHAALHRLRYLLEAKHGRGVHPGVAA